MTKSAAATAFLAALGLALSPAGGAGPMRLVHICGKGLVPLPVDEHKRGDDGCQGACHARCPREHHFGDEDDDCA